MTQIHWLNAVNGNFNTASDWSTNSVPGMADDAILNAPGAAAYTVTVSTDEKVNSIQTGATATLSIAPGHYLWATAGTGTGVNAGTILVGTIGVNGPSNFQVGGALNNSGLIALNSGSANCQFFIDANTTLSGHGHVTLSDSANNNFEGTSLTDILTNVDNTISGAGSILLNLINQAKGVIDATGSNTLVLGDSLNVETITNAGLIQASGAGGLTFVGATVVNTGAGVIQANYLSTVTLDGTNSTVSLSGPLVVADGAFLVAEGVISNAGTISLNGASNGSFLNVVKSAGATFAGGGQIVLSDNSSNTITGNVNVGANLTNVNNTISGAGNIGNGVMEVANEGAGVIDATGSNVLLVDVANTLTNAGVMEATGGHTLLLEHPNQTMTVDQSGGGTILAANASTVSLVGDVVVGGFLKTSGTGVISESASTLDGTTSTLTLQGLLTVANNAGLKVQGAIANAGTISLLGSGNSTGMVVGANTTLSGGGHVTLSDAANNSIFANSLAITLTNIDNTISGAGDLGQMTLINQKSGVINATGSANALTLGIYNETMTITNAGLIEASGSAGLTIISATVNNTGGGVIQANAGSFVNLDGTSATVSLNGALNVTDNAALTAEGTIANTGTISLLSFGNTSQLIVGAGALTLTGNGAVALGAGGPNLIVAGGAGATLTNDGNTISGAGQFFSGNLTLVNQTGIIDNYGVAVLTLPTVGGTFTNGGTVEGTGSGGVAIDNATVDQSTGGSLFAAAGSNVSLTNVVIIGGTLKSTGTGKIVSKSGANLLDGSTFTVTNQAAVSVLNNAALTIQGTINDTGKISLAATTKFSDLIVGSAGATLTGGGSVTLGANLGNRLFGVTSAATLTNVNNKISGAGLLGNGQLTLVNQTKGLINASGSLALTIDTGANIITNAGTIEATGAGGAVIAGAVNNTGMLKAAGGNLTVDGAVTGTGSAMITGGTLYFASSFDENVTFKGTTGVLELAQSQTYTHQVKGFSLTGGTALDLRDIKFVGASEATYVDNGKHTGGVLTVNDGLGDIAHIKLVGNYGASTFVASDDGHGGVTVVDPPKAGAPTVVAPHALLAAMAGLGAHAAGQGRLTQEPWRIQPQILAAPRCQMA